MGVLSVTPSPAQVGTVGPSANSVSVPINLTGVVLNATNGNPIARVLVRVNDRAMLTDHEGKFEFDQFTPSGSAMLEVRKPGFYFGQEIGMSSIALRMDQMSNPIVVRLYPEALMTGTLTSSDGLPLTQVAVSAQRRLYNEAGYQWVPVGYSMTNSHGEFRLAVPPGDYRIQTNFSPRLRNSSTAVMPLTVPSFGSSAGSIHLSSGVEERFDLHPVVSLSYTVGLRLDPSPDRGFPMIVARSSDGATFPASVMRSGPNQPDEMRVALPTGTYTLIANMNMGESHEYGEATVNVTDQDIAGVTLHLAPVPPIPVQVQVDSESTPDKTAPTAQQLGLTLHNAEDFGLQIGNASFMAMMSSGQETYLRPTPGIYHFSARGGGQWFVKSATYGMTDLLQQNMVVAAGAGSSPLVVTVSDQTGSLQGSVKHNETPMTAWVYAVPTGSSATPFYNSHSGTDGNFTFTSLPPGTYQLIAFESRHSLDYRDPRVLAPFSSYIRSVTVGRGNKATTELNIVPDTELNP